MNTLSVLLKEARKERGLSYRQAAEQVGTSRTTIQRIEEGEPVDVETLIKICNWIGVSPSTVLDAEGLGKDALAAQIAAVMQAEPGLAEVFSQAMARVINGDMDPHTFRDLAAYAAYRLGIGKEQPSHGEGRASEPPSRTNPS
jgi:transcriptional regulator with XRE-family HTH domain